MATLSVIIVTLGLLYLKFEYKLDYTVDGKLLLWYSHENERKYKILIQ